MAEETKEAENFFEELRRKKAEKFMAVGFTREQSELLVEELKTSALGFGIF